MVGIHRMPGNFQSAQAHDPTQYMGQGNDFGTQYRSGCLECLEGLQKWPWNWPWFNELMLKWSKNLQDDGMNPTASEMGPNFYRAYWQPWGTFTRGTQAIQASLRGLYYFDEEQKRLFEESRDAYQATMIWWYLVRVGAHIPSGELT